MKKLLAYIAAIAVLSVSTNSCRIASDVLCKKNHQFSRTITGAEIIAEWSKSNLTDHRRYSFGYQVETCIAVDEAFEATFSATLNNGVFRPDLTVEGLVFTLAEGGIDTLISGPYGTWDGTVDGEAGGLLTTHADYSLYDHYFMIRVYGTATDIEKDAYISQWVSSYKFSLVWPGYD